ncbi:hypothetical protein ABZP36_000010 [Zizania latifolia]
MGVPTGRLAGDVLWYTGLPLGWARKTAAWRLETASGREGDDWRSKNGSGGEEGLRGMGSPARLRARRKTTSLVPSSVLLALNLVGEVQFPRQRHVRQARMRRGSEIRVLGGKRDGDGSGEVAMGGLE